MEAILFIATIAALYGAYLVSNGNFYGFAIWIFTNMIFFANNLVIGQWEQAFLFGVYMILAVNGVRKWAR